MDKSIKKWAFIGAVWGLIGFVGFVYLVSQGTKSDPYTLTVLDEVMMGTIFLPGAVGLFIMQILDGLLPSSSSPLIRALALMMLFIPSAIGAIISISIGHVYRKIEKFKNK